MQEGLTNGKSPKPSQLGSVCVRCWKLWYGAMAGVGGSTQLIAQTDRAVGARFWRTPRAGACRWVEGTWLGWGKPGLRWWGCSIERHTRGAVGPKSESGLPGLGFVHAVGN